MNVVMVTHDFPRADGDLSGAPIWRLAAGLADLGHAVSVIAPADRGDIGEPMLGNVRVRRVRYSIASREDLAYRGPLRARAATPHGFPAFLGLVRAMSKALTDEVRITQAHVIHAHYWIPAGLAVRLGDRAGRPWVLTLHGTGVTPSFRLPLSRAVMAYVLRQAAVVTAVSSPLAAAGAEALGVPAGAVPLTPMPVALGHSPDPDAGRHGAIVVGTLKRANGVHVLLEAAAILKREGVPLDLTIVGDGPERTALKAQAIALGIPVSFTGFSAPELITAHLRDKRLFVLPALEGERGFVLAEALTQGVPVVATRVGAAPDFLIDPDAGVLVPPGDAMALAVAMRMVLKEDRFKVGALRAGRLLADRLSAEKVAAKFEAVYMSTRGRRSSTGTGTAQGPA